MKANAINPAWEKIAAKLGFPWVALPEAASDSAESAIRFLVNRLMEAGLLNPEAASVAVRNVLKRERLGSTDLEPGIALPHAKSSGLEQVIGIVALCPRAVPWEEATRPEVEVICLVLAPWIGLAIICVPWST